MEYREEDYLQLSGIQHFKFCRRQWALAYIEQLWQENYLTTEGKIIHENAHDKSFTETRNDTIITRGVNVFSPTLGVSGECDVLEFHKSAGGITLPGRNGTWQPYPVEYKHGKPSEKTGDTLQLCGQAMCLEEMLCRKIPEGALYYYGLRKRVKVEFTTELRREVEKSLKEMHEYYKRGYTPKVKPKQGCKSCSLKELCLPEIIKSQSAQKYMEEAIGKE